MCPIANFVISLYLLYYFPFSYMPKIKLSSHTYQLYVAYGNTICRYKSDRVERMNSGHRSPYWSFKTETSRDVNGFMIHGDTLYSYGDDGCIRTYMHRTGKKTIDVLDTLNLHRGRLRCADMNDDVIVSWSTENNSCLKICPRSLDGTSFRGEKFHDYLWSIRIVEGRQQFLTGGSGHRLSSHRETALNLWDIDRGERVHAFHSDRELKGREGGGVYDIKMDNYNEVLTCGYDTSIRLWDLRTR